MFITEEIAALQRREPTACGAIYALVDKPLDNQVAYYKKTSSQSVVSNDLEDLKSHGFDAILEKAMKANISEPQHIGTYLCRSFFAMHEYRTGEYCRGTFGEMDGEDQYPTWEPLHGELEVFAKGDHEEHIDTLDLLKYVAMDEKDVDLIVTLANGDKPDMNERTKRHRIQGLRERYDAELDRITGLVAPTIAT